MKRDNTLLFAQLDFKPFRVFEEKGKRCEFYNLTSYKNYEIYMEDLYTQFEDNNNVLKILVHPDYYEASKALFEDRMLPYLFEYWPLFNVYAQRQALSKIFTFIPLIFVAAYFITQLPVLSFAGIIIAMFSFVLVSNVRKVAKRINECRDKMIKVMTVEKNEELKTNLDRYYQEKSLKLEELSKQRDRDAQVAKDVQNKIDKHSEEITTASEPNFDIDQSEYEITQD